MFPEVTKNHKRPTESKSNVITDRAVRLAGRGLGVSALFDLINIDSHLPVDQDSRTRAIGIATNENISAADITMQITAKSVRLLVR